MIRKRTLFWVVLIVVIATGGALGSRASIVESQAASTGSPATSTATATKQASLVVADVSATGTLRASQAIELTWEAAGKVAQVLVKKGETVEKSQILAELDPASNQNWATLEANLQSAQQNLASLQDVAVEQASAKVALVKAQNAVTDAQNALNALYTPPTQAAIDAWKLVYRKDQAKVTQAQENYDYWVAYEYLPHCDATNASGGKPGGAPGGGGGASGGTSAKCNSMSESDLRIQQANAKSALSTAQQTEVKDLAYLTYLQNYQPDATLLSEAQTALAVAEQQLVVAQANYDAVKGGPDPAEIAVAKATIHSIQSELDKRYLRAPFAGTITDLEIQTGDVVSSGTYALRIDNLASMLVDLQVSEIDIDQVKVGQTVQLSFDGVPDKQYQGTVSTINPIGSVSDGVASFTVTAVVGDSDSLIRPGMTAAATFISG